MKKHFTFVALLVFAIMLLVSCGSDARGKETELYYVSETAVQDGYKYYTEKYTYSELSNPERADSKMVNRTGYRVVKKNLSTGEIRTICIDPLCDHSNPDSCPAAFRGKITCVQVRDACVYYLCQKVPSLVPEGIDDSRINPPVEFRCYNQNTGELKLVFREDYNEAQDTYIIGDRYIWYTVPDIVDGKTVFVLNRYELTTGNTVRIAQYDDVPWLFYVTDQRVYIGHHPSYVNTPEELDIISIDYNGKNPRKEDYQIYDFRMVIGSVAYAMLRTPVGILWSTDPHVVRYDFTTREKTAFPLTGEPVLSLGYRESDNRIYYMTGEGAIDIYRLNPTTRAEELGMSVDEFRFDEELVKQLDAEFLHTLYGTKSWLKSCNPDGSDVKTVYEFPAGQFFYQGMDNHPSTGCVSYDGKLYYVQVDLPKEGGGNITRDGAIVIDTGELVFFDEPQSGAE